MVTASGAAGALILLTLTALIRPLNDGQLTRAIFCTAGYPWYLVMFALTFFVPDPAADDAGGG